MFYDPRLNDHGLPHDPFKSLVVPRPIGWISTISLKGVVNLAPYSYFNAVANDPYMVMFAPNGRKHDRPHKDSRANTEATGEFVVNLATFELREKMNATSTMLPADVDELSFAGLTPLASRNVRPPRVAESPVHLECRYIRTVDLPSNDPENPNAIVLGEVVGVHIREEVIRDGLVDVTLFRPIARLGYAQYAVVERQFTMPFPD